MYRTLALIVGVVGVCAPALAGDIVVTVSNITSATGEVACALHANGSAFPMGNAGVTFRWQKANPAGVTCRFTDVPAGTYAVAVLHDLNGNRRPDTNFVGLPTEDWGVSNNIRHSLRPPTFDEAKFTVEATGTTTVRIRMGR